MRPFLIALGLLIANPAVGQAHGEKERKEDIRRHRAMAAAHEAAAKCLESGNSEKECLEKLRQDCKGLGIGKYCGLRHQH
jgi:hypothetical protein